MPLIGVPVRYDYSKDENKPIIYIFESVRWAIQAVGGEVFLIVPVQDVNYIETKNKDFKELSTKEKLKINSYLDICDGLFLSGGTKFTPYDRYILDYAIKKDIPTLGICLSMQMMSCYKEDVRLEKNESNINHHQKEDDVFCHSIKINKNSKLYKILGKDEIEVNSFHYYHALENHIYKTVAKSSDGIIEAIEHPNTTFNIGIQWHPEKSYKYDINSMLILSAFIAAADKYKMNKKVSSNNMIINAYIKN